MTLLQDAFISYGRPDSKAFAVRLYQQLSALGYSVWIDQADIPFAVNYQTHIDQSIERMHNLIFILSPHAVNSHHCTDELDQALRYHKRIIPLMHVEQISRATWQQRHPDGTEADWQDYQAKGLHVATRNLHPGIAKLNWIGFRQGLDDCDRALEQLVQTLEDRKAYVHQHTDYLVKALAWAQNQHQPRLLLSGADREAAEAWHKQAIDDDPPFCQPTDLHCEFITESTKYAEGQLAQVFLCYADEDTDLKESIRRQLDRVTDPHPQTAAASLSLRVRQLLMRAGFTVWDRRRDLVTGARVDEAIYRGIEGADSFIFLLSPNSVQSRHCLNELNYALALHKRIIPVLVKTLAAGTVPTVLKNVQLIDLHDTEDLSTYQSSSRQLVATLGQDAAYFRDHKRLLVQALKWERQRYNPSVLLRGAERRFYEGWFKAARQRQQHTPIEVQERFVTESLSQPASQTLDVFLIADPKDLDFARHLHNTLQLQGKSTWFDQITHRGEIDATEAVREAIESAQNCIVILSGHLLGNRNCLKQIQYAQTINKRMVGVVDDVVEAGVTLPAGLGRSPIVSFQNHEADFSSNFGELYRILESDAAYVDQHTRLLLRAMEWDKSGRDDSLLLRRKALEQAQAWLAEGTSKIPVPTSIQQDYIAASQTLPFRKMKGRSLWFGSVAITLTLYVLRLLGGLQALELAAYDTVMRLKPSEALDSHLLLVTVDEASGAWLREQVKQGVYQPGLGTIPDGALAETLGILAGYEPAVIGLDFYRDFEATPPLAEQLRQSDNVFGICKATYQDLGVEQPPELPNQQVGFSDLAIDAHNFVRRYYLKHEADPPACDTDEAFGLRLARTYLEARGISYTTPFPEPGRIQDMAFGAVQVPQLWAGGIVTSQTGGYSPRDRDVFTGYQSMINYRQHQGSPRQFAPQVTLQQVLSNQVDPALVRGRIVLIGYIDLTDRNADSYNTPQGELAGVMVHGQMISQLVNAALEQRPLIWWWPVWLETLWIALWALIGGLILRQLVRPLPLVFGGVAALMLLVGISYGALTVGGGWLPLVPALLAGLSTAGLVAYLNRQVRNP